MVFLHFLTELKSSVVHGNKQEATKNVLLCNLAGSILAGDQWWPFFVTFYFLVTDILCLVIQYFGSIN